jgi:hypothetical protein
LIVSSWIPAEWFIRTIPALARDSGIGSGRVCLCYKRIPENEFLLVQQFPFFFLFFSFHFHPPAPLPAFPPEREIDSCHCVCVSARVCQCVGDIIGSRWWRWHVGRFLAFAIQVESDRSTMAPSLPDWSLGAKFQLTNQRISMIFPLKLTNKMMMKPGILATRQYGKFMN